MAADHLVGAATEQHERPCCESHGTGGIVGGGDRKTKAEQAGDDRLHHPFSQATAAQAGSQAEQVCRLAPGLQQGALQRGGMKLHIGVHEQHPVAVDLLHGSAAGPVLAHPALATGPGAGRHQAEAVWSGTGLGRCPGHGNGVVARVVIHQEHTPAAAGGSLASRLVRQAAMLADSL